MNFLKIINSKLINKAELARMLWPDIVQPKSRFQQKMKETQGRKFTEDDKKRIIEIIKNEVKNFNE